MREHLLIVGGGQAAAQAAHSTRQSGFDGAITLVSEENSPPYQRPPLSKKYLAGEIEADRLLLRPEEFYLTREIDLELGTRVDSLDPVARTVRLDSGAEMAFTQLLLATGSEPRRLELPGSDLAGIHYMRTIADASAIRQEFASGKKLLIVGAGYIGLEVAAVAAAAGLSVTVLEAEERVMARAVCPEVSAFYADLHRRHGVDIRLGAKLTAFRGDTAVRVAETAAGERLDCDIAIIGIGIVPRIHLAEQAGLAIDNGIAVDELCRTKAPNVLAAGDCTSYPHPWAGRRIRPESVQNAFEQGKTAAASICGEAKPFTAIPWFWSDQYDVKLQIAGLTAGFDQTVIRGERDSGSFAVFYLKAGEIIAVDAVNDAHAFTTARQRLGDRPRWPVAAIADPDCDLSAL